MFLECSLVITGFDNETLWFVVEKHTSNLLFSRLFLNRETVATGQAFVVNLASVFVLTLVPIFYGLLLDSEFPFF